MPTLGKKKTVVMTTVWFSKMTGTCTKISLQRLQISTVITFRKSDIWSYTISTLVRKCTGYNKSKQKLTQILPFTELLKGLSLILFWRLLKMKEQFTYS